MVLAARLSKLVSIATLGIALVGCGGGKVKLATSTSPGAASSASSSRDPWGTVWLCRPGLSENPCVTDLTTTAVAPSGKTHVERAPPASRPAIDCFYVYPTISSEQTINADLAIGLGEREVAIAQASRFSQACRLYAPVYRQITLSALEHPARITLADELLAYDSVRSAFRNYLAHYNHGRGIVFIGHSQGAVILTKLLEDDVDETPAVRRRLVSALLLGGNVTKSAGGDFTHIPACRSSRQTGCVVAYSSFTAKPPENSQFGRTTSDAGLSLLAPHSPLLSGALRILCVNPASPAGGTGLLDPYIPSLAFTFLPAGSAPPVQTAWVSFPGQYSARCESSGNATWLQITPIGASADRRRLLTRLQDPALGLHLLDVNIALGNLVQLVRDEAAVYHHS